MSEVSNAVVDLEPEQASDVIDWEETPEERDNLNGMEAGRAFAHRHIIEKMNLFIEEYRRNNYSDIFVEGFVDGINEVTGGNIHLEAGVDDEQAAAS
jgi:hypothetical protein